MITDVTELPQPVVSLWYAGAWGKKLDYRAYVFDQEMARIGIRYSALLGVRYRRWALLVSVPETAAGRVAEVIARLERPQACSVPPNQALQQTAGARLLSQTCRSLSPRSR